MHAASAGTPEQLAPPAAPGVTAWWRRWPWTALSIGIALLWLVLILGPLGGDAHEGGWASLLREPMLLVAVALAWTRSRLASYRQRLALRLIALAVLAVLVGELLWATHALRNTVMPRLGIWDGFFLAYFPLMLAGVLALRRQFLSSADIARFVLDALIVSVGGGMFVWQFGIAPFLAADPAFGLRENLVSLAYPIGDLLTLVGVAAVLLRLPVGAARASHVLLALALIASLVGDLSWLFQGADPPIAVDRLARGFWYLQAVFLVAAAESIQARPRPDPLLSGERPTATALPYLALTAGYGLFAWAALYGSLENVRDLLAWASVLTFAVVVRQILASRENASLLLRQAHLQGENRLAKLIENAAEGVLVLDRQMAVQYASPAASHLFGLASGRALGRPIQSLLHPDDAESLSLKLHQLHSAGSSRTSKLMLRFTASDGAIVLTETSLSDQREDPALDGVVLNIRDVTAHHALEDQLRHDALHDALTQLPGRELFLDRTAGALARIGQGIDQVAVVVLEIDQYRLINDSLGLPIGDQLLQLASERLRSTVASNTLARVSDSVFALLFEQSTGAAAFTIRVDALQSLFATAFLLDGKPVQVSASIGLAASADAGEAAATLLQNADTALALARADGGARYRQFAPEQHRQVLERLRLRAEIPAALHSQRFEIHLQPVVGLVDGYPIALRPRLAWRDPGQAPWPIEQIRLAAHDPRIGVELGEWIVANAQREFASVMKFQNSASHLSLLMALDGHHLHHPELLSRLRNLLDQLGLAAVNLTLSITEESLADRHAEAMVGLRGLSALGVRLALAEFGGRASSLAALHENLFDTLILSGQLVRSLTPNSRATALVRGVIALGEGLGTQVIASGVDTEPARELLAEFGCLYGVGSALAPAMPVQHLLPWLGARLAQGEG